MLPRLALLLAAASAAMAQPSVLLDAMSQELNRNFTVMKEKADPPPYFLSYEVTEVEYHTVSGTLGTVDGSDGSKNRALDVSVRVGSPKLDNYHRVRTGGGGGSMGQSTSSSLTFEDSVNSIKHLLWLQTDRAYRAAAERLIRIKTNTQVKVAEEDSSDDFSIEPPSVSVQAPPKLKFDKDAWQARVRKLSARFGNYPSILTSHVTVSDQNDTRYFVNTEGSRIEHGRGFARVIISASAKASDGTDLTSFETFEAVDADGLPDDKVLQSAIDRVANDVSNLLKAP
jgi:TldD protein